MNARGELDSFVEPIRASYESCVAKVGDRIPLHKLDVVVYAERNDVVPEVGMGGYSPSSARAFLAIDPDRGFQAEAFECCLAHELHHCVRWHLVGYGSTLRAALVSEGLACRFEVEVTGARPPIYATSLSEAHITLCLAAAEQVLDAPDYDHGDWFYGTGALPRFAGYSIGYRLVAATCARLGLSAGQLVGRPPRDFFEHGASDL